MIVTAKEMKKIQKEMKQTEIKQKEKDLRSKILEKALSPENKAWASKQEEKKDIIKFRGYRMIKDSAKTQKCLVCGKRMHQVKDKISGTFTGHQWRCSCMPKDLVMSIG